MLGFVDYLVGRLSGRFQPGNPSLHRRERRDKKSQINDAFFLEKSRRVKNAKAFPSRFAIMPYMTTKEYYQNITKGGSRFNETRYTSTAKCVPTDNVKKMDGIRDGIEFCTRKRLQFIKKVHPMNILTTTSLKIRKNFANLQL